MDNVLKLKFDINIANAPQKYLSHRCEVDFDLLGVEEHLPAYPSMKLFS